MFSAPLCYFSQLRNYVSLTCHVINVGTLGRRCLMHYKSNVHLLQWASWVIVTQFDVILGKADWSRCKDRPWWTCWSLISFFCEGCFEIWSENKILSMDYLKPHHRAAVFHLQLLVQACTIVYNWVLDRTSCHQGPERPPGLWGLIPGWGHQCTLPGTPGTLPMHIVTTRHTTNAHYNYQAHYQCTL